jgi:plastocyanin
MRFNALALVASAIVLGACGGGNDAGTSGDTPAPAPGGAAGGTAGGAAATPAPITGTTHVVNMVGDDKGYRFEPANIPIKAGDGIRFVSVSIPPHNVGFDPALIPDDVEGQLNANMPETMAPLEGKMLATVGESYTVSFANIKPGTYRVHCTPHRPMNMYGTITVQ